MHTWCNKAESEESDEGKDDARVEEEETRDEQVETEEEEQEADVAEKEADRKKECDEEEDVEEEECEDDGEHEALPREGTRTSSEEVVLTLLQGERKPVVLVLRSLLLLLL